VSDTAALYHLQTLDSQRDQIRAGLAEIDRQLSQNEAVRSAQAALEAAQAQDREWQTRASTLELKRTQLRDEATAAETRLYSGEIMNPRELTELQEKVAELSHRRDVLEDPLLEAMLEIEERQAAVTAAQSELDRVLAEQQKTLGSLTTERESLLPRLDQLENDISVIRQSISARFLTMYDELRKRPGGVAVTEVRRSECSICGVEINSRLQQQIGRGEVFPCPTCGRILVVR
jgi:predicted  nucleic acid-binding Zn-ribbon protein